MIDPKSLEHKSSDELSVLMNEYEGKIQAGAENVQEVKLQYLQLGRSIIELQRQKKDVEISLEKAKHLVQQLESDHSVIKTIFFNNRRAGM